MDRMDLLYDIIFSDCKVVVITGAGISTLSGIPDFRGIKGLYSKGENIEYFLSLECFLNEQDKFYEFYKKNLIKLDVEPNIVHATLASLQKRGLIGTIITQNIDGLHEKAGSLDVINLHGNGNKFYCTCCNKEYDVNYYLESNICNVCDNVVRPDIVLYEERVNKDDYSKAIEAVRSADKLIVLGSTLSVDDIQYVVANFIVCKDGFKREDLFIINLDETSFDRHGIRCEKDLGLVFKKIYNYNK